MSMDKLSGKRTLNVSSFLDEFEKDRIKEKVDIVALFSSFGVELKKKGKSYMGECPWHEDSNPSLSVDRVKGLYNCFGCGESGDAFTLVEKMKGVDFKGSLEYLKGARFPFSPEALPVAFSAKEEEGAGEAASLLAEVAVRYARDLASSAEAKAYLVKRGIGTAEIVGAFRIGYVDGTLGASLSEAQKQSLTDLGILGERGREHFERCVVVPLYGASGTVTGLYGRRIDDGNPVHLYLKGPHSGLVNRDAARVYADLLILTESVIDALSLFALGIRNVIPCYGANGFTKEHEALLVDERVKEVVIAFDSDDAGRKGAEKLSVKLSLLGFSVKIRESTKGKDWNDFLLAGGTKAEFDSLPAKNTEKVFAQNPPQPQFKMTREAGRYIFTRDEIRYRLTGVRDNFLSSLRVGVRLSYEGRSCVDTVDLYSGRSRASFALSASQVGLESSRIEADLLLMLDALEAERDEHLVQGAETVRVLSEEEKEMGIAFLRDKDLFTRIGEDLSVLGYVGEDVNKILIYLAASSRKLDDPVSVIVSSQSAAGKSYLIDTVKRLMPEEDVVSMTSLSDQALNYLADDALLHKFLVMGEALHSSSVEHQIREMLSAKELARLVTMKDEKTGEMTSKLVRKDVIVSMVMSTTSVDVNPENASRCFVIAADESEAQTRAIHEVQRGKYSLSRLSQKGEMVPSIIARHKAAQRVLRKIGIVNPFASSIGFPARLMRTRRDHERFLDLIACVCFLRQYQKETKHSGSGYEYVECDMEDYRIAYGLMQAILPLTLSNFPVASQALYDDIRRIIHAKAERNGLSVLDTELSQREIREATSLSQMAVKRNVRTLVDYEYLSSTGFSVRGAKRAYKLVRDETLNLVDLSTIPTPGELCKKIENVKSGASGSAWVTTGSDPLLGS
jgi:DNA primase